MWPPNASSTDLGTAAAHPGCAATSSAHAVAATTMAGRNQLVAQPLPRPVINDLIVAWLVIGVVCLWVGGRLLLGRA